MDMHTGNVIFALVALIILISSYPLMIWTSEPSPAARRKANRKARDARRGRR